MGRKNRSAIVTIPTNRDSINSNRSRMSQKRLLRSESIVSQGLQQSNNTNSFVIDAEVIDNHQKHQQSSAQQDDSKSVQESNQNRPTSFNRNLQHRSSISSASCWRNMDPIDLDDIETTTSRSIIHGLILIAIMITSLGAFVCSKVRKCSYYSNLIDYENCSKYFLFYSTMTMVSCLMTFVIYFLHLITQCKLLCLKRKKYEFEIMLISIISMLLGLSSVCYVYYTNIRSEPFTLVSLIFATISNVLFWIRMIILIYEMILIRKHLNRRRFSASIVKHHAQQQRQQQNFVPIGSTKSNPSRFSSSSSASFMYNLDGGDQFLPPQTSFNSSTQLHRSSNQPFSLQFIPQSFQSSLVTPTITTTTKTIGSRAKESTTTTASMNRTVISYVRNNQRSKTLSTSLSDDFEDDVFIQ